MSDGRVHRAVGTGVGAVAATLMAQNQSFDVLLIEAVGGAIGGNIGARLPDVIDPPTSPFHRSIGHGVVPVGGLSALFATSLPEWQARLRAWADELAARRAATTDALDSMRLGLAELFLRLLTGALAGLLAGYLSHVGLDALTPMGVPLLA